MKTFLVVSQSFEFSKSGRRVAVVGSWAARSARFLPGQNSPNRSLVSTASPSNSSLSFSTSTLPSSTTSGISSASWAANSVWKFGVVDGVSWTSSLISLFLFPLFNNSGVFCGRRPLRDDAPTDREQVLAVLSALQGLFNHVELLVDLGL